jgi:hypothetical protein
VKEIDMVMKMKFTVNMYTQILDKIYSQYNNNNNNNNNRENCSPFHVVQTGSGAHLASYPMGTGGFFLGSKAAEALN